MTPSRGQVSKLAGARQEFGPAQSRRHASSSFLGRGRGATGDGRGGASSFLLSSPHNCEASEKRASSARVDLRLLLLEGPGAGHSGSELASSFSLRKGARDETIPRITFDHIRRARSPE